VVCADEAITVVREPVAVGDFHKKAPKELTKRGLNLISITANFKKSALKD